MNACLKEEQDQDALGVGREVQARGAALPPVAGPVC